jgi:4,5-DOPA dioxygenase extradiol
MNLNQFMGITAALKSTDPMPVIFAGHGSPMNAIEKNEFTDTWQQIGQNLPKPVAILCISAHWETNGTFVTAMQQPSTIHDFGGFPQALFDVQYPAPGNPQMAAEVQKIISTTDVKPDNQWGLDHGCWSILKHMFPEADVPVLQLSLDYYRDADYHYRLAGELAKLRSKGVLILGSGNIVHNLRMINWHNPAGGFDWALEADALVAKLIQDGDHQSLINYRKLGKAIDLAIPSPEHYLPLLYILALFNKHSGPVFFNNKTVMGSISMTSLIAV